MGQSYGRAFRWRCVLKAGGICGPGISPFAVCGTVSSPQAGTNWEEGDFFYTERAATDKTFVG